MELLIAVFPLPAVAVIVEQLHGNVVLKTINVKIEKFLKK